VTITARIQEHGDHIYITTPVALFAPDEAEIEGMVFAKDLRSLAPNPNILWLKGQYVEADQANRNADQWTAGELAIKQLTPVLMPITVMHDLRSAVGTIADAKLMTPQAHQVPRARIDSTLAVWAHRFPEVAQECRVNAQQSTLMQSMECITPAFDCSVCGAMMQRDRYWQKTWKEHIATHSADVLSSGRSPARILRNVTFTGVGLIFGTRGSRGAMPDAYLQVDELAAMHREAHEQPTTKRPRRKNTVDLDDSKYQEMVTAAAQHTAKIEQLQADVTAKDQRITELEAKVVKVEQERDEHKQRADTAEEASRVAAMAEERLAALGTGFMAKLSKMETTAKVVRKQAGEFKDEDWTARLAELEELLGVKRDAKADDKSGESDKDKGGDSTAGQLPAGLFTREQVASSSVGTGTEVTAGESGGNAGTEPTVERRQSVMGGLVRPRKPAAAAKS
jgi:uncharacterized protein with FMN-binding domain